jgi:hypothetical protein
MKRNLDMPWAKLFLISFLSTLDLGCRDREHDVDDRTTRPEERHQSDRVKSRSDGLENPVTTNSFIARKSDSDRDLLDLCRSIIDTRSITYGSENAERLADYLSLLLERNSPVFYEAIELLPPGYHSESLMKQVFGRYNFGSLAEIIDRADPIDQLDLSRAAIDGATALLPAKIKRGEARLGVTMHELNELKASGISTQNFAHLVTAGIANGELNIPDLTTNITPDNNLLMSRAVRTLPHEISKELIEDARGRGIQVDSGSVRYLASSLAQQNPYDAIAWASSLSDDIRYHAVDSAMTEWLAADPMEASRFVGTMSKGDTKDDAIRAIVRDSVRNADFEAAYSWAKEIANEQNRGTTIKLISETESKRNQ